MQTSMDTFKAHFSEWEDPRTNIHNQLHSLEDILLLTILAVLSGADDWVEIEDFGQAKLEWLKSILELRNGIPSHDTLGRVFGLLDAEQLQNGFLRWVSGLANLDGEFLAVDGKTLRGAYAAGGRKGAIHTSTSSVHRMVSAWGVSNRLVFGQLRTSEKSNEITAIPELLKRLNLTCAEPVEARAVPSVLMQWGHKPRLRPRLSRPAGTTLYRSLC